MPVEMLYQGTFNNTSDLTSVRATMSAIVSEIFEERGGLIDIAINEAIQNAVQYGEYGTEVNVKAAIVNNYRFVVRVGNRGPGFDVKNYLQRAKQQSWDEEELEESGRGIMIMHSVFDSVVYNKQGTEILLMKEISDAVYSSSQMVQLVHMLEDASSKLS